MLAAYLLALDEPCCFPLAASMLQRGFYVDDLMTGTDTIEDGLILQKALLEGVALKLSKWCSNNPDILVQLPEVMKQHFVKFKDEDNSTIKTLGMFL